MAKSKSRKKNGNGYKKYITPTVLAQFNNGLRKIDEFCNEYLLDAYEVIQENIANDTKCLYNTVFKDDREFLNIYITKVVNICMELEFTIVNELNDMYRENFYPKLLKLGIDKKVVQNKLNRYYSKKMQEINLYSNESIYDVLIRYSTISILKLVEVGSETFLSFDEIEELKNNVNNEFNKEFNVNGDFLEEQSHYIRKAIQFILISAVEYKGDISNINWIKYSEERDEIGIINEVGLNPFLQLEKIGSIKKRVEISNSESVEEKNNYHLIDDWKELSYLANSKGYELIRANGDHGIFKNKDGYTVVIPQGRAIGKGLSIDIQKRLDNPQIWI